MALMIKNPPANAGDAGSVPGSGRFPGGGNGNPLQYSCLENPMDRGAWRAAVHGVAGSDITEHAHIRHNQETLEINEHLSYFKPPPWRMWFPWLLL